MSGNKLFTVMPAEHVAYKIQDDWEVEEVIGMKKAGSDTLYEVRWANTWVIKEALSGAPELLQEFEAKLDAEIVI